MNRTATSLIGMCGLIGLMALPTLAQDKMGDKKDHSKDAKMGKMTGHDKMGGAHHKGHTMPAKMGGHDKMGGHGKMTGHGKMGGHGKMTGHGKMGDHGKMGEHGKTAGKGDGKMGDDKKKK